METTSCYDFGASMNGGALRKPRITRAEAAKLLGTSYANVRKLQSKGALHSNPDRYGVHRFDRREVEELARKRGLQIKPSGELAARVFAMFKANRSFADIVIETQQDPGAIRELRKEYDAGFTVEVEDSRADNDEREQAEHEAKMREIDREFERRRRVG
jgi:hypothetical protein